MEPLKEQVRRLAASFFERMVAVRRHLHRHPELSFLEFQTSTFLQAQLTLAGIPFTTGHAGTGIVATIKGGTPGPVILLRGDMDALPILEENDVEYRSHNNGVMHSCGHDVHSSCVLGAAWILDAIRDQLAGTVKVMFQPGEELLPGGASLMIADGVLDGVSHAIALHVFPDLEAGHAGFREGMYMASTDEVYLTVRGKGGHAAMPSGYVNPLLIASEILLAVNERFMSESAMQPDVPTVVAFGKISGDGATNVIPEKVELAGTVRTMDEKWRQSVHAGLHKIVSDISSRYGIASELRIEKGYPVLHNDPAFTAQCRGAAVELLGPENVHELPLRMTAEDFAFVTQRVPSCFFRLGTGNKARGITAGVHTPRFDVDEAAIGTGAELLAWLTVRALSGR